MATLTATSLKSPPSRKMKSHRNTKPPVQSLLLHFTSPTKSKNNTRSKSPSPKKTKQTTLLSNSPIGVECNSKSVKDMKSKKATVSNKEMNVNNTTEHFKQPNTSSNKTSDAQKVSIVTDTAQEELNTNETKEQWRWVCAICRMARFDDYDEACRHEETCQGVPTGILTSNQNENKLEGEGVSPNPSKDGKYVSVNEVKEVGVTSDNMKCADTELSTDIKTTQESGELSNEAKIKVISPCKRKHIDADKTLGIDTDRCADVDMDLATATSSTISLPTSSIDSSTTKNSTTINHIKSTNPPLPKKGKTLSTCCPPSLKNTNETDLKDEWQPRSKQLLNRNKERRQGVESTESTSTIAVKSSKPSSSKPNNPQKDVGARERTTQTLTEIKQSLSQHYQILSIPKSNRSKTPLPSPSKIETAHYQCRTLLQQLQSYPMTPSELGSTMIGKVVSKFKSKSLRTASGKDLTCIDGCGIFGCG